MRHIKLACTASILAILAVIVMTGCVSSPSTSRGGKPPSWLNDKDSVYPTDEYLAEVGEGDSLKEAKASASGAIAQIFSTRITVDSTIRTRYTEITGEGGSALGLLNRTDIDESIGQSSDETLVNLRYGEAWTSNEGRVYTVAYLDRAETGMLYRQRIVDNDSRILELRHRADSQDDPLRRFAFLDAATVSAEVNQALIEQLEIINLPMASSFMPSYNLGDMKAARADQGRSLRIRIEVFGNPDGRIGAILSDWVTTRGFSSAEDGDMFLSAMVKVSRIELNNDYENLGWEMNLNMLDFLGIPAVTLNNTGRSSGISDSAAEARAFSDMSELVTKDFDKAFSSYLNSYLDK